MHSQIIMILESLKDYKNPKLKKKMYNFLWDSFHLEIGSTFFK